MNVSHLKINQAGAVALFVWIVGQVVAFVPDIAAYQSALISAGSAVIPAVWVLANGLHKIADSNVPAAAPAPGPRPAPPTVVPPAA